jgi:hypothetical protein
MLEVNIREAKTDAERRQYEAVKAHTQARLKELEEEEDDNGE